VGRFTRDKGIAELYEAFTQLQPAYADLRLLLVGDFEAGDPVPPALRARIEVDPAVIRTGFVTDVEAYYWTMDLLALPTYREGFPGAPLEAQAASVPVVTTDATGAADAIVDGITGLRVPAGDVGALAAALDRLLADPELRARMGQAGCSWVQQNFQRETVWESLLASYRSILQPVARRRQSRFGRIAKAALDRPAAALALILSAPLWLAAAIAIRCSLGSPVLFRQMRPGLGGRPFTLFKFRTMRDSRGPNGELLADRQRLTALGRLLRALSVDELPQLWNVLRGEMSLVGPRPLLMEYLDRYTPEQARRHEVRPGITGWAQINGRNAIGWKRKLALDVWYVDHWSLMLDMIILARTLRNVLLRQGISNPAHATMPEFLGGGK
jgi:lipopolysaccharide/colanic/teichoic acid biosynthesis glycosyltransferase